MISQSFKMAFASILSNKMRSFLTMLGIIIGVLAVVVLVSLVNGATSSITDQVASMGTDRLSVSITNSRYGYLTMSDLEDIEKEYDSIGVTAPVYSSSSTLKAGTTSVTAQVTCTTADYADIDGVELARGRYIKTPDVDNETAVCVMDAELADDLFSRQDVVGETVSVDGRSFKIVGVTAEDESSTDAAADSTVTTGGITIPFTTGQHLYLTKGVSSFYALAADSDQIDRAESDLEEAMLSRLRNDEDAYRIMNSSTIAEAMTSITGTLSLLLGGIAGISLLVGGIGIMNIMLVSVSERTREIGIRKAIGAKRKRILMQFLIEALVVSGLGGLIGLLLSVGILAIVSAVADMSYTITGSVVAIAIGFSVLVGIVFGIYPANKASKLKPIDALRTE